MKEIKQVLLYPDNDIPIAESIEKIINDIPSEQRMPKKLPKGKSRIETNIDYELVDREKERT